MILSWITYTSYCLVILCASFYNKIVNRVLIYLSCKNVYIILEELGTIDTSATPKLRI